MALVALKSTAVTNQDLGVAANSWEATGGVRSSVGLVTANNNDNIGSTYRLTRIPSNARLSVASLFTAAITTGAGDVGLYRTAADGGAVVDADFFIAAQSIATASAGINVIGGNLLSPANRNKRVWEALGLAADPGTYYDVAITLTAATTGAGAVGIEVQWTV
jgi:hypothetical protein